LTPTFNRARYLPRLHRGLCEQTFRDFEWLVVDDGSTDETATVVHELAAAAPDIPVRFIENEHGGKHTAVNRGVTEALGTYCAILDSDDWYVPHSLERLKREWESIPDQDAFAEVQGLCATADGKVIGSPLPEPVLDSDYYELTMIRRIVGDRVGMHRTAVLRDFPFPDHLESQYVPDALIWNRIARRYRTRCINEVLGYKEYLEHGLSHSMPSRTIDLAGSYLLFFEELLDMGRPLPADTRLRAYANLSRFGLHTGRSLRAQAARAHSRLLWATMLPVGVALALRDRLRRRHRTRRGARTG
jgi:glycosyltransferase involved in cell wall biosynthesis